MQLCRLASVCEGRAPVAPLLPSHSLPLGNRFGFQVYDTFYRYAGPSSHELTCYSVACCSRV
jgi:hypothetical protein